LHDAGAFGIEIDIFAVWGIFRAVVETGRGGQAFFFAAAGEDRVDVKFSVAFADECEGLTIG